MISPFALIRDGRDSEARVDFYMDRSSYYWGWHEKEDRAIHF